MRAVLALLFGLLAGAAYADTCTLTLPASGTIPSLQPPASIPSLSAAPTSCDSGGADPCSGSPAVGTVCADGTVYVGLSPDGNVPMFTTRCDAGMSWNGSTCTGTRSLYRWADNMSYSGGNSQVSGRNNTTLAIAYGVTGGAVQYCDALTEDGRTDWYLPATNELQVVYNTSATTNLAGTFSNSYYYWTSTELDSTTANLLSFSFGNILNADGNKPTFRPVRCARH